MSAACLFLISASVRLVDELAHWHLVALAAAVESSSELPKPTSSVEEAIRREAKEVNGCNRRMMRARVTVILVALRMRAESAGGINRDDLLFAESRNAVDDALACNPLDGNLWFLSGWFSRLANSEGSPFHQYLFMSITAAPLEGKVLEKRWTMIAPVLSELGILDHTALVADLANMLAYTDTKAAVAVLVSLRDTGSWQMGDAALALISNKRRQALTAAANPRHAPVLGSKKFKQFDFTPVGPVRREAP